MTNSKAPRGTALVRVFLADTLRRTRANLDLAIREARELDDSDLAGEIESVRNTVTVLLSRASEWEAGR